MNDDVVAVLQRAKERVAAQWCQGANVEVPGIDSDAIHDTRIADLAKWGQVEAVCTEGALWCETSDWAAWQRAASFLRLATGSDQLWEWNDTPGRAQVEVLDAFDAAIRLAKESA